MLTPQILVAGRNSASVRHLETLLAGQEFKVMGRVLTNGQGSVLAGLPHRPDAVVLCCGDDNLADLESLAAMPAAERPPLVICGALRSSEAMRLVLRCGAEDLLPENPDPDELVRVLQRIGSASQYARGGGGQQPGRVVTVVGAAGGVGASLIASNLAYLATRSDKQTALLVDLDLQFSPLTAYLGIRPDLPLSEAVSRIDALDAVAVNGYIARHRSGLGLLSGTGRDEPDAHGLPAERFRQLLQLLVANNDFVFVDAMRWLDPASTVAVLDSAHVVMVIQQTIGNVHNAVRLYRTLTRQLGVPRDRIVVVVNRHSRRAAVSTADIERALVCTELVEIGSEYDLARDSLDAAVPVTEKDRRSSLSRALGDLSARIGASPKGEESGFLKRAMPLFRRGET